MIKVNSKIITFLIKKIHSENFLFVEGSAVIRVKSKVPRSCDTHDIPN